MNNKTHPLFTEMNDLWKVNRKFVQQAGEYAKRKYPNGFNLPKLVDASIEYYQYIKTTTMLEDMLK